MRKDLPILGVPVRFRKLHHEGFGRRRIRDVKVSECKLWCQCLAANDYKFATIQLIKNVLRPAFQMAVDDDLLWKNPFDFRLNFIANNAEKGFVLSYELEDMLFDFMQGSEYYCKYVEELRCKSCSVAAVHCVPHIPAKTGH